MSEITNQEFAARLRKLADIYEANDFIPRPYGLQDGFQEPIYCHSPEIFHKTVKAFGQGEKGADDKVVFLQPSFFPGLRITAFKDVVCERVVVGKKQVPETTIPARKEEIIPAHEREIIEWRCKPFTALEDSETEAA